MREYVPVELVCTTHFFLILYDFIREFIDQLAAVRMSYMYISSVLKSNRCVFNVRSVHQRQINEIR